MRRKKNIKVGGWELREEKELFPAFCFHKDSLRF